MSILPLCVLSGYLGSGKTSFLNRLLAAPEGQRIAVLVNDFGAIAIDARLIENAEGQTIALTNGCACCAINGDLYGAVDQLLRSGECYDLLMIEASGVADPAKLIQIALAEPELRPAGVLTLIDLLNFENQLDQPALRDTVLRQVNGADRLMLSKGDLAEDTARTRVLEQLAKLAPGIEIITSDLPAARALPSRPLPPQAKPPVSGTDPCHPAYATWSYAGPGTADPAHWRAVLCQSPGVLRMKGFLNTPSGPRIEVQLSGQHWHEAPAPPGPTELVAIGLAGSISPEGLDAVFAT